MSLRLSLYCCLIILSSAFDSNSAAAAKDLDTQGQSVFGVIAIYKAV